MNNIFGGREIRKEYTEEFVKHAADNSWSAEERFANAVKKLENNFSCVADYKRLKKGFKIDNPRFLVVVIAERSADIDEIQRGVQSIAYWVSEGPDDT